MAAHAAGPELDPCTAGRQALLTSLDVLGHIDPYLVDVGAFGHELSPLGWDPHFSRQTIAESARSRELQAGNHGFSR